MLLARRHGPPAVTPAARSAATWCWLQSLLGAVAIASLPGQDTLAALSNVLCCLLHFLQVGVALHDTTQDITAQENDCAQPGYQVMSIALLTMTVLQVGCLLGNCELQDFALEVYYELAAGRMLQALVDVVHFLVDICLREVHAIASGTTQSPVTAWAHPPSQRLMRQLP